MIDLKNYKAEYASMLDIYLKQLVKIDKTILKDVKADDDINTQISTVAKTGRELGLPTTEASVYLLFRMLTKNKSILVWNDWVHDILAEDDFRDVPRLSLVDYFIFPKADLNEFGKALFATMCKLEPTVTNLHTFFLDAYKSIPYWCIENKFAAFPTVMAGIIDYYVTADFIFCIIPK